MKNLKRKLFLVVVSALFCMWGWAQDVHRTEVRVGDTYSIRFKDGASDLDLNYMSNQQTLTTFVEQIKSALESRKYSKVKIRVARYTTGSGALAYSRMLNDQRLKQLEKHFQDQYGWGKDMIMLDGGCTNSNEIQLAMVTEETVAVKLEVLTAESNDVKANKVSSIHFKVGKSNLELEFRDNKKTLDEFVGQVKEMMENDKYEIVKIRIVGYASPEGNIQYNNKLSEKRALTLKDYLKGQTSLADDYFEIVVGGENWKELADMVKASDMNESDKKLVLDEISKASTDYDPEQALRALPGGLYYKLYKEFFPKLRSASSVQLWSKVVVPVPVETVQEEKRPEPEPEPQAEPEPESPCRCEPPFMAIKTNLAYWAALFTPNIELEFYMGNRFSFSAEGVYRWFKDRKAKGNTYNVAYVSPELRMYNCKDKSFRGHYWGVYGQYGEYDLKIGHTGKQGRFRGLGLSYGYIFKFNRYNCFYFDLGISAGYGRLDYDSYYWYDPCNVKKKSVGKNYWGPTKMKASLVWRF